MGDLALRCTVDVESDEGELLFELRKGGRRFQCRIDVATGQATLSISGQDMAAVSAHGGHAASAARAGTKSCFSNCDNELRLWVDGSVVPFDAPTAYDDLGNTQPDATDLAPVGVASVGREGAGQPPPPSSATFTTSPSVSYAERQRLAADDSRYLSGHALPDEGRC